MVESNQPSANGSNMRSRSLARWITSRLKTYTSPTSSHLCSAHDIVLLSVYRDVPFPVPPNSGMYVSLMTRPLWPLWPLSASLAMRGLWTRPHILRPLHRAKPVMKINQSIIWRHQRCDVGMLAAMEGNLDDRHSLWLRTQQMFTIHSKRRMLLFLASIDLMLRI